MMKNGIRMLWLLLIAAIGVTSVSVNAAQLYRWVDKNGNVEWRDTPPPSTVPSKNIEQRRVGGNVIGTSELPFSTQLAAKNHPITFWSATDCRQACDNARAHLSRRGVPYTEKNPQADLEGFKKVSPANEVPILQVGAITLKGYLESEWDSTLDSAGYPRSAPAVKPKPVVVTPKPDTEAAKAPAK